MQFSIVGNFMIKITQLTTFLKFFSRSKSPSCSSLWYYRQCHFHLPKMLKDLSLSYSRKNYRISSCFSFDLSAAILVFSQTKFNWRTLCVFSYWSRFNTMSILHKVELFQYLHKDPPLPNSQMFFKQGGLHWIEYEALEGSLLSNPAFLAPIDVHKCLTFILMSCSFFFLL